MNKTEIYALMSLDTLYHILSDITYRIVKLGNDPKHLSLLKEVDVIEEFISNHKNE